MLPEKFAIFLLIHPVDCSLDVTHGWCPHVAQVVANGKVNSFLEHGGDGTQGFGQTLIGDFHIFGLQKHDRQAPLRPLEVN
eukprot:Skav227128  [mRNA]  locus=scaffold133:121044:126107:+ [translate_table: standard]